MLKFIRSIPTAIGAAWRLFHETRVTNHAILIRGSVLDPDNHPSKDR